MKNKKKSSGELKFGYIFLILVFVAGLTFLGLSIFVPKKDKGDDSYSTAINETEKTEAENNNDGENPDKTPKKYEEDDDKSDATKINADIAVNDVSNGKYTLQITIYELISDGTCKLHMENANGSTVDRTAKIVAIGPDSSSCDGFDMKTEGIDKGTYDFSITLTSGSKTGVVKGTVKI